MSEAASLLHECDVVGWVDSDVLLRGNVPLDEQPQLAAWLRASDALFFASREPPGAWTRGSAKDAGGRNNLNNTRANTGFLLSKRTPAAQQALRDWWCAPLDATRKSVLDEPSGIRSSTSP